MFAYYPAYEPRTSYPHTRNFYQPAQYSRPCSYYHNNTSPFYNFYSSAYDDQLFREQEERERLKRLYERKTREQQPKKSFKIKIQGGDDEAKSTIKSQAAHKIINFIKNQTANKQTRKILNKLHILHIIENELKEIHKTKYSGNLTFDEGHEKQILPISIENKRFLEYEDKIVKLLDKLDGIQSEGADIIRERRKLLVKLAQNLLGELDNEKEKQWKKWKELNENSDVVMDDAVDKVDVPAPLSVLSENDSREPIPEKQLSEDSDVAMDDALDKVDESDVAPVIEENDAPTLSVVASENDSREPIEPIPTLLLESQPEDIEDSLESKIKPYTLNKDILISV